MIRAHQPGSEPIDIPETIPNPVVVPKPTPTPTEPAPKEPVRIPEKVPQSGVSTADSCTAGMPWTAKPRSSGRSRAKGAKAVSIAAMGAAPPLNLGNMLRATDPKVEAEAALRAATRADPTFAEAWYNLSDLLDEQGRSQAGSIVCGVRLRPRPTMPTRCLILRFRYSEVVGTRNH